MVRFHPTTISWGLQRLRLGGTFIRAGFIRAGEAFIRAAAATGAGQWCGMMQSRLRPNHTRLRLTPLFLLVLLRRLLLMLLLRLLRLLIVDAAYCLEEQP